VGTVLFFVVLFAAVIGAYFIARATPKNVEPRPIDASWSSIADFYRNRPERDAEVDLGDGWSSAVDPGASFELSWISQTSELVVLRRQAHADFASGGGLISAVPRGLDPRATGMKVLAVVDLATVQATHPDQMRAAPDGLDRLTARLGRPYGPPGSADPHWATATPPGPDGSGDADR
jgi:hypothetical protein